LIVKNIKLGDNEKKLGFGNRSLDVIVLGKLVTANSALARVIISYDVSIPIRL
jgi:hypothetical protein